MTTDKTFSSVQALAALRGVAVDASEDDHGRACYTASRGALTRSFSSPEAVRAWLEETAVETEA